MHDDGVYVCVTAGMIGDDSIIQPSTGVSVWVCVCVCVHMSQDSLIVTLNQGKPWWQQLQYGQFYPILTDIHNV